MCKSVLFRISGQLIEALGCECTAVIPLITGTGGCTSNPVLSSRSLATRDMGMLDRIQRRAVEPEKGLEHESCEERLTELGVFSLEERGFGGDLIPVYKCLTAGCSQVGLASSPQSQATRGSSLRLHQRRFTWYIRKKSLIERAPSLGTAAQTGGAVTVLGAD